MVWAFTGKGTPSLAGKGSGVRSGGMGLTRVRIDEMQSAND